MNDREFLMWIYKRMEEVHRENPHYDYMYRLYEIADNASQEYK
tara:strand:+ start:812 stop:940 length:129 start_codon:yes stop_codon:yes gene_type:complete